MKEEDDGTESSDQQAHKLLMKRCSRNEFILRFLSMLCVALMFALFILQLDILWRARQSFVMEVLIPDSQDVMFSYPPFFYDIGHSEDIWTWDPRTHLLKVNTSFYVH
ncbi:uncharacterized protein LOC127850419 [Dreissena polymorpha]|uniref:Uncharacterized protein n=1 Tax=Dreissena polymorpha TaxID=45954 RepID=A0A9D4D8L0_DREPO|nr:uncharacterized protein LOC127850419 [Dreissena polymorpha]KAH3740129.1 hypothetical protein DPMN_046824 [Dreissena polymorpha]